MAFEIVMPKMGESIVEGTIIEWKKNIGDFVEKDEILLEISTDKVDSEIPSSHEGFLLEVYFQKNETVEVGKPIALIGGKNESVSSIRQEKVQKNNDLDSKNITLESKKNQDSSKSNEKEVKDDLIAKTEEGVRSHQTSKFYSPLVKSIARKEKIDLKELESLNGSGANGRINKVDILNYLDNKNKTKGTKINDSFYIDAENNSFSGDIEPIDHIRKSISDHMLKSIKTSAHVYSAVEVDVTSIVDYIDKNKDKFLENNGIKITYTPFFLEACIEALQKFPLINSSFVDNSIHYHNKVNLGVAVALPDNNLIVPVIKNAEEKSFIGLLRATSMLAKKARSGKLSPDDVKGATFTLTNPGVFGSLFGMAIINQPNVAILSTGAVDKKPIVKDTEYGDAVFIRSVMFMTLGYDHRIIDGAYGSKFLVFIKDYLESINLDRNL